LDDIYITIRLYETDDPELVDLITDATNTQSAIGFRDKISNKPFNIFAKELFKNKGIGYITKRGEVFINSTDELQKTIHSTSILPLWYSSFYEAPTLALTAPKIMYKEVFQATSKPKHALHAILNGAVDSPLYSQMFLVYSIVEIFKNEYERVQDSTIDDNLDKFDTIAGLGNEYLVFLIYKLVEDDLANISNERILSAIYELVTIIKPIKIDPTKVLTKSMLIDSIIDINLESKNISDFHSSVKTFEGYINLFTDSKSQQSMIDHITNCYVNIDNLVIVD